MNRLFYSLCVIAIVAVGCRVRDVRTFEIHCPGMVNQACVDVISRALAPLFADPNAVQVDLQRRMVTVTYDSLTMSRKNIEFFIADAGFAANDIPADQDAAATLPEACRATTAVIQLAPIESVVPALP